MTRDDRSALGGVLRRLAVVSVAGCVVVGAATPAAAHITISPSTTEAGAQAVLEVSVPHGCAGSPTTGLTIQIPDQVMTVTPTRDALWDVVTTTETLDPPVTDSHGRQLSQRVASVTFRTDVPLPEGYRDVLELSLLLPDLAGETLIFPTIQTCEEGEAAWIEVATDGQDAQDLELPAPTFVLTAADEGGAIPDIAPATARTAGDEGDPGAVDPLTVAALAAGVVGAVLGATALVLQRRRT